MNRIPYIGRITFQFVAVCLIAVALNSCGSPREDESLRQEFTFVQICDTQLGMGGYEHDVAAFKQAVVQINALKPDFVVICGDLVNDRNDKSFADFKTIQAAFTVPCHCVPGNHDVGKNPTLKTLQRYRETIGKDYDSFEHKGYTFVLVNTQIWKSPVAGESEKQDQWLKETLAAAAKKKSPSFVVGHYPLFLESPDEPEEYMNLPIDKRIELLSLYKRSGVVAVLGGHAHRLIVNEYEGIQLVNGETTSRNFDGRPMGFRVWHVSATRPIRHEFIAVTEEQ